MSDTDIEWHTYLEIKRRWICELGPEIGRYECSRCEEDAVRP